LIPLARNNLRRAQDIVVNNNGRVALRASHRITHRTSGITRSKSFALTGNQWVPYIDGTKWFHIASMDDDAVFRALADASRRQLLDRLHQRNGQTLGELCQGLDMTRQAVAKHLAVLQEANLVSWKRNGREKLHFINPVPINEIAERWISKFERSRLSALSELKKSLEGERDD
jgi:DNA-binding transcriptional ArsR family regulator